MPEIARQERISRDGNGRTLTTQRDTPRKR
ncbi:hypothetical protein BX589_13322 [Paraburkholderia fungorum]|jgi:hypothetical protein|nr:hypothetical protein BX589_13322 [Paraburkholderia fungorum]